MIDINKKYGRLTPVRRVENKNGKQHWLFRCDCGTEKEIYSHRVEAGGSKSCGCYKVDMCGDLFRTHGGSTSKIYKVYKSMVQRCTDPNTVGWERYGGRGITCSWKTFEDFHKDMGDIPFAGATIDRIDNDKGYSKENCRWTTAKEQANNRRTNHMITYQGKTQSMMKWAEETGIKYRRLRKRKEIYDFNS